MNLAAQGKQESSRGSETDRITVPADGTGPADDRSKTSLRTDP